MVDAMRYLWHIICEKLTHFKSKFNKKEYPLSAEEYILNSDICPLCGEVDQNSIVYDYREVGFDYNAIFRYHKCLTCNNIFVETYELCDYEKALI